METSFLELRCKQVINVVDGKCLGRIIDIVFDCKCGTILGLVVPPQAHGWACMFKPGKEIFIPYHNVCKIGVDTILIEYYTPCPPQSPLNKGCPPQYSPFNVSISGSNSDPITLNKVDYELK